jgi:hypothetical protein
MPQFSYLGGFGGGLGLPHRPPRQFSPKLGGLGGLGLSGFCDRPGLSAIADVEATKVRKPVADTAQSQHPSSNTNTLII